MPSPGNFLKKHISKSSSDKPSKGSDPSKKSHAGSSKSSAPKTKEARGKKDQQSHESGVRQTGETSGSTLQSEQTLNRDIGTIVEESADESEPPRQASHHARKRSVSFSTSAPASSSRAAVPAGRHNILSELEEEDDDDEETENDEDGPQGGVRASPSSSRPTTPRPKLTRRSSSRPSLPPTDSASSTGSMHLGYRPRTPSDVRPGYIHRVQTPTGTRFVLRERSPSEESLAWRLGSMSTSQLSLASRMQQASVSQPSFDAEPGEPGLLSADSRDIDQNMMSVSGTRKAAFRREQRSASASSSKGFGSSYLADGFQGSPPAWKGHHKRSDARLGVGNDEFSNKSANDTDPNNMSFASSRHYDPNWKHPLRKKRAPTIAPNPYPATETLPTRSRDNLGRGEDPTRPSYEAHVYTRAELEAYEKMREAYACSLLVERAAEPLHKIYRDPIWSAQIPPIITPNQNSAVQILREALALFREEMKEHPVYVKFQADGNDIAQRAANDIRTESGNVDAVRWRVYRWEYMDAKDGIGELQLPG